MNFSWTVVNMSSVRIMIIISSLVLITNKSFKDTVHGSASAIYEMNGEHAYVPAWACRMQTVLSGLKP